MLRSIASVAVLVTFAQAQQEITVPAAYDAVDANSRFWIGGVSMPVLQQTIVDAGNLQALAGRQITALTFRREAADEAYTGGSATLTVKLSTSPRTSGSASSRFADNIGPDETTVFAGPVTLPNAPPVPGPASGWGPSVTVTVVFSVPFAYGGGALCIEVTGTPDPQQPVAWWPADAVWDGGTGSAAAVGAGCGPYGGSTGHWAGVASPALTPGGTALFYAYGTPGQLAFLAIAGRARQDALDLGSFGMPGCHAHVVEVLGTMTSVFGPRPDPGAVALGGPAFASLDLPNQGWLLGATLGAQWFDLGPAGIYSSNGLAWTVASSSPTVGMTLVSAHFDNGQRPTTGRVFPGRGHVMRLRYR